MVAEAAPRPITAAMPALDGPGDPHDYDSLWYKPLRVCGVSAASLAAHAVRVVMRPNERAFHPEEAPGRLYWRYAVPDEEGTILTHRLAAVDRTWPRSAWDGPACPDVLYDALGVVPGQPVVIAGDVLGVWALRSSGIAACTFLCGPHADVPARAVAQLAARRPSGCLVVDNMTPALPRHAPAVVAALRAQGLRACYVNLWTYATCGAATRDGTMVDLVGACGGDAGAVWARLDELQRERLS